MFLPFLFGRNIWTLRRIFVVPLHRTTFLTPRSGNSNRVFKPDSFDRFLNTWNMDNHRIIVLSGASGAGKSTLVKKFMKETPGIAAFSVSHTTRKPRVGEVCGTDYHFVSKDDFEELLAGDAIVEHARFSGNYYGTSKKAIEDVLSSGRVCILDLEVNGVKALKKLPYHCRFVFVRTVNHQVLEERLRVRGTENEETLQKRLVAAKEANNYANEKGAYDFIIVNDNLETAYKQFRSIMLEDVKLPEASTAANLEEQNGKTYADS